MSENGPAKDVYSILVGVDYSEVSESALAEAVTLARTHELAHIHVMHSVPGMPPLGLATRDLPLASPPPAATHVSRRTLDMSRDVQVFVERVRLAPVRSWSSAQSASKLLPTVQRSNLLARNASKRGA